MFVALVWTAIMAVRLHELFPQLAVLRPAILTFVLGCAVLAAKTSTRFVRTSLRDSLSKWVIAYVAWAALSVPTALWGGGALNAWIALLLASSVYFVYALCRPTNATYDHLSGWLVVLTCANGVGLLMLGTYTRGRLSSTGAYDANDIAALTVISLPFAIMFLLRSKTVRNRLLGMTAVTVLLATLMETGSRGGILALVVSMTVFMFGFRGRRRSQFFAVAAVAAVVGWQVAGPQFKQRMLSLTNIEEDYNVQSDVGRKQVWIRGLGYAISRPVTGVGIGNFPVAEGGTLASEGRTGKWSAAHSSYVQALAELGFPGALIFLGLLSALGRRALALWRDRRGLAPHRPELLAGLVSYMVASAFLSHAYFSTLFMLAGLIAIAERAAAGNRGMPPRGPRAVRRHPHAVRPNARGVGRAPAGVAQTSP